MSIQTTHRIYDVSVSYSSASRLFEYIACKEFISPGDRVLDFGCNSGTGIDAIYNTQNEFHGIDVVPELKGLFADKYKDKSNVHLSIVTEGEVPFEDNYFDVVLALNLIEHLEDVQHYLKELRRITKPGGRVIIATVNRHFRLYPWQKPWNPYHVTEFGKKSLEKLLAPHFDSIDLRGISKTPPFFPDYVAIARKRKFTLGIKHPIQRKLSAAKRALLGQPRHDHTAQTAKTREEKKPQEIGIEIFDLSKFAQAFKNIELTNDNKKHWIELFAICVK